MIGDENLHHITGVQSLVPGDFQKGIDFCNWLLQAAEMDQDFVYHLLRSDEAIFSKDVFFNLHNSQIVLKIIK